MLRSRFALLVLAVVNLTACGLEAEAVRPEAAFDLQCSQVAVRELSSEVVAVSGCGRQVSYVKACRGHDRGDLFDVDENCSWHMNGTVQGELDPVPPEPTTSVLTPPDAPDRDEVKRVLDGVQPNLRGCAGAGGMTGNVYLSITVVHDGRVSQVAAEDPFAETPVGKCLEGVIRELRFPIFRGSPLHIRYPVVLR